MKWDNFQKSYEKKKKGKGKGSVNVVALKLKDDTSDLEKAKMRTPGNAMRLE